MSAWLGAAALKGGKGYAQGPLGQIHYRVAGPEGRLPFLLIHQTPMGMSQYVDVQATLAAEGYRSIAPDNPGYGFSDPIARDVAIAELAEQLRALCNHLSVPRVVIVGHHTGAAIAASFAAQNPARTAGVILHGLPLYNAEERAERLARPQDAPVLNVDGSHFSNIFLGIGKFAGIDAQTLSSLTWTTIGVFLAAAPSPVYRAVFANDMAADLAAIRAPTLLLTDSGDSLHANTQRAAALRPDFQLETFSDGGSFALMREPARWARRLIAFAVA